MIIADKRIKNLVLGSIVAVLVFLIWLRFVYSPLMQDQENLRTENATLHASLEMLQFEKQKLDRAVQVSSDKQQRLEKLAKLLVPGNSVQEVNASTQALMQKFWESHNIALRSYKEGRPEKWRKHTIGVVDYNFACKLEDLSNLLVYLDGLEKVMRIEKMTIRASRNRKRGEDQLMLALSIGTLFVDPV